MAYFCLTVLEADAGGRRKAAVKHSIHELVLGKLGELTSDRGDRSTARKMSKVPVRPLSGGEIAWIEETIKRIILRMGDQRPLAELPKIMMTDLPPL